jgi:hypothetical protein
VTDPFNTVTIALKLGRQTLLYCDISFITVLVEGSSKCCNRLLNCCDSRLPILTDHVTAVTNCFTIIADHATTMIYHIAVLYDRSLNYQYNCGKLRLSGRPGL